MLASNLIAMSFMHRLCCPSTSASSFFTTKRGSRGSFRSCGPAHGGRPARHTHTHESVAPHTPAGPRSMCGMEGGLSRLSRRPWAVWALQQGLTPNCLVLAPCFYKLMILQPSEEMVNRIRTLMTLGQPRCSSDHNALFERSLTTTPPNTAWSRVGSQTVPIQPVPTSTKGMEFTNSFQGEGKDSPNEGSVLSKRRNEQ